MDFRSLSACSFNEENWVYDTKNSIPAGESSSSDDFTSIHHLEPLQEPVPFEGKRRVS
jgi:hypothetical protein